MSDYSSQAHKAETGFNSIPNTSSLTPASFHPPASYPTPTTTPKPDAENRSGRSTPGNRTSGSTDSIAISVPEIAISTATTPDDERSPFPTMNYGDGNRNQPQRPPPPPPPSNPNAGYTPAPTATAFPTPQPPPHQPPYPYNFTPNMYAAPSYPSNYPSPYPPHGHLDNSPLTSGSTSRPYNSAFIPVDPTDRQQQGGQQDPYSNQAGLPNPNPSNYSQPPPSTTKTPYPQLSYPDSWATAADQATSEPLHAGSSRRSTLSRTDEEINLISDISRPNTADISRTKDPVAKVEPDVGGDDEEEEEEEKMDHRKRKRNRTIRSCVPCHNHKRKCDRKRPCGRCTALGLTGTCVYEVDEQRDMSDPTIAESERLRRRIAELEQVVRELRQKQPSRVPAAPPPRSSEEPDREQDNKKRRVIVDRLARFKIDEAALAEVAAAATKGETGGDPIPQTTLAQDQAKGGKKDYKGEPYHTWLLPGEEMVHDRIGRKTFLGAPAGRSMLRRIRELTSSKTGMPSTASDDDLLSVPDDNAFTIVFPDLRKTFPFTTIWSHDNFSSEIMGLLPNREQAEILLQAWKEEVVPIILAYHVPTLEAEYRRFFAMSAAEKTSVPMSRLAVYLMICACGCVMRAAKTEIFGGDGQPNALGMSARDPNDLTCSRLQSELYLSASYQALRLCSFLSNPTIYTIQAQVLINTYLYASERAADVWALIGSLVRQCIALGLHVDPVSMDPNVSMRDAEIRRRIWWSVAGLDALTSVLFGRPSCITYYTTNLPQDRTDDNLSEAPGSAQLQLPPSNVLRNETTDMTFHAAYYQLTIPSCEMLSRVFHMKRNYSRSALYGWFSPQPESQPKEESANTYEDALRLARDIQNWYNSLPRGIRYEPDEDTPEVLKKGRSQVIINQTIMLCVKTYILIMILHRPYLRLDPAAYPESKDLCLNAATTILRAYEAAFKTNASVFWVWWSIPYRAFHAGAVCAFLAIREPGTELAKRCHGDLRNAIVLFEDRLATWRNAHPVQADLVTGLIRLEKLATAALARSRSSPMPNPPRGSSSSGPDASSQYAAASGVSAGPRSGSRSGLQPSFAPDAIPSASHLAPPGSTGAHVSPLSMSANTQGHGHRPSTPLANIRGFPDMGTSPTNPATNPMYSPFVYSSGGSSHSYEASLGGEGGSVHHSGGGGTLTGGGGGGFASIYGEGYGQNQNQGQGQSQGQGQGGYGQMPAQHLGNPNNLQQAHGQGEGGPIGNTPFNSNGQNGQYLPGTAEGNGMIPSWNQDTLGLPQFWADMFGIRLDGDGFNEAATAT